MGVPPPKAVAFVGEADFGSHLGDDRQEFLRELLLVVLRRSSIACVATSQHTLASCSSYFDSVPVTS